MQVRNRDELVSHGYIDGRKKALDIIEYALEKVDPYQATKDSVRLSDGTLFVGDFSFNLVETNNIYVVGAGKATYPIACALDEILGDRITDGYIVVKDNQKVPLSRIQITEASHPVPDERGLHACRKVFEIAEKAYLKDIVFCLITGGSSALCPHPVKGISFSDKKNVHKLLITSGADIMEINTVRRHLSAIKGGRLTQKILPATIINLTVSDVIGDDIDWNTDWTTADPTTLTEAENVLKKYDLWDKVPESVRIYFSEPSPEKETPKDFSGKPLYSHMVVKSRTICEAAAQKAKEIGLIPHILSSSFCCESREAGRILASIAREIKLTGNPVSAPCVLIVGGENVVSINEKVTGLGGPNQELAASASLELKHLDNIVVCAMDSDGTDGPTPFAGAIIDSSTYQRATDKGYDISKVLMEHNVSIMLKDIHDVIDAGANTGTNVNDIILCIIR